MKYNEDTWNTISYKIKVCLTNKMIYSRKTKEQKRDHNIKYTMKFQRCHLTISVVPKVL